LFLYVSACKDTNKRGKKQIFPYFFIPLPPTQGDKRGSRTKNGSRNDFRFPVLFFNHSLSFTVQPEGMPLTPVPHDVTPAALPQAVQAPQCYKL
jgi:hypothetical protein